MQSLPISATPVKSSPTTITPSKGTTGKAPQAIKGQSTTPVSVVQKAAESESSTSSSESEEEKTSTAVKAKTATAVKTPTPKPGKRACYVSVVPLFILYSILAYPLPHKHPQGRLQGLLGQKI